MKKILLFVMPFVLLAVTACGDDPPEEVPTYVLTVDKATMSFTKEGGDREIKITSNQKWEIVIENDKWLTTTTLEGEGDKTVKFTADPFDETQERYNTITVKSSTITREVKVAQSASDPRLDVNKKEFSYNYRGGIAIVEINSNTAWEIVIDEKDRWVTSDIDVGTGDGELTLTIEPYNGKEDRNATVIVKCEGIEQEIEIFQTFPKTVGVWILSEGNPFSPAADLAYYDVVNEEMKTTVYSDQNGDKIGMIANFMGLYGSKLYIAVAGPSDGTDGSVKVVDPKTGKLIKNIPMKGDHGEGDLARQMAFHDGKVYVTSYFGGGKGEPGGDRTYYGGVVKIDTVSLAIEDYTRVGDIPEGILYHDNKLFVFNNEQGNGTTMSIIDIDKFEVTNTVTVPQNPVYIEKAADGDIYFSTKEIYLGENKGPSAMHQLNPTNYSVRTFDGARADRFAVNDRYIFTGEFSWTTYSDIVNRIDRQTGEVVEIDIDHMMFMVYGFDADPTTGEIWIGGSGEDVMVLSADGQEKLKSFKIGTDWNNQFVFMIE